MGRPDTIKAHAVEGGWNIPCPKCGNGRFVTDRANARKALKEQCRVCAIPVASKNRYSNHTYVWDKYKVFDDLYNVQCYCCGEDRFMKEVSNVRRAVKNKTVCHTCAGWLQTGIPKKDHKESFSRALLNRWSISVRKNQSWTCQVCFSTDNIEAHHIISKVFLPGLAYNLNNGIALCNSCHNEYHYLNGKTSLWKK